MQELNKYLLKPLVLIGALNWGLVGFFNFDLVAAILGPGTWMSRIVYAAVGLAAVLCIILMFVGDDE